MTSHANRAYLGDHIGLASAVLAIGGGVNNIIIARLEEACPVEG